MLLGLTPLALAVAVVGGYLLGSIPFGVLATRWGGGWNSCSSNGVRDRTCSISDTGYCRIPRWSTWSG